MVKASIGPRASARGNGFRRDEGGEEKAASIGPRASARGNQRSAFPLTPVRKLQLGHARPRVETRCTGRESVEGLAASIGPRASARGNEALVQGRRRPDRLQLGHARPRVETSPQIEERTAMERFNWATRVRAWKLTIPDSTKLPLKSFNWATRVRAWKQNRLQAEQNKLLLASIGPRASARGNL